MRWRGGGEIRRSLVVACMICCLAVCASAGTKLVKKLSPEDLRLPGKKGIGLSLRDPGSKRAKKTGRSWNENIQRVKMLDVSWNYSWGAPYTPVQPAEIEFMPMVWGKWGVEERINDHVLPGIKQGKIKRLLGFNEPDHTDQANMPYMQAIKLWPELMRADIPLCSPSCANTEGIEDETAQGVQGTWMRDFMREADKRGYRVDYIGTHNYGGGNAESFKAKMCRIYEKYGKRPLLITEFAVADWKAKTPDKNRHQPEKVLAFMKEVLPWLERQDWIAGYAWFPFNYDSAPGAPSALFDKDGNLTPCGRYYKSVTPENPDGDRSIR